MGEEMLFYLNIITSQSLKRGHMTAFFLTLPPDKFNI